MRVSTRATCAFAARRGVRARDARPRHNCPARFEIAKDRSALLAPTVVALLSAVISSRRISSASARAAVTSPRARDVLERTARSPRARDEYPVLPEPRGGARARVRTRARARVQRPHRPPALRLRPHPGAGDLLPHGLAPRRGHLERPRAPGAPHPRPSPRRSAISTRAATYPVPALPRPSRVPPPRPRPASPPSQDGADVARFSVVNRRTRRLCADEDLWRELCARRFDIRGTRGPPPDDGWRGLFRLHHETLFRLFRGGGEDAVGRRNGSVAAGLAGVASGALGGVRIQLGA